MKPDIKIDLNEVVRKSLRQTGLLGSPGPAAGQVLTESYVSEPKKYGQVTEFSTQRSKDAHYTLYEKAVEALNKVSAELDTAKMSESDHNHSQWASLKRDEVSLLNTVWLHELFFANCFDPHSEVYMDSITYLRLERDFGTFEEWQKCFIACAMAVSDGWAVTGYDMFLRRYITVPVECDACNVPMGFYPVIVLDCHEHAYWKDYLGDKRNYIVAFMREFNWNIINERVTKAEKMGEVLK